MKAVSLRGIRDLGDAETPLPDEVRVLDQESALIALAGAIRSERALLLRNSDWTQIADNNLTTQQRAAFAAYRASLRDIPEQAGFPFITWPQPPVLQDGAGIETGEQS